MNSKSDSFVGINVSNFPIPILDSIQAGVAIVDDRMIFLYANELYCQLYGYTQETLIGNNFSILVPDEEISETIDMTNKFLKTGGKVSREWKRKHKDGDDIYVASTSELIEVDGVKMIVITVNDITGLRKVESQLAKTEDHFKSQIAETAAHNEEVRSFIMDAALDAIICMDLQGRVTRWNPQAEKTFGYSKDEAMGSMLSAMIIPERYRRRHDDGLRLFLKTGRGPALNKLLELSAIDKSGREFPIELTILPITQEGKTFFCAFLRDITDRKSHETMLEELNRQMSESIEKLAKSNTELEQFAYIASHDLQEPLRMVTGFLTQLEKKYEGKLDEKGQQYLAFAVDGAVRMRKIILDLLEYSKIGKMEISFSTVDTKEVIAEVLETLSSDISASGADIQLNKMPVIMGQPTLILQLFQNLVGNAIKYRGEHVSPLISVGALDRGSFWEFSISDNGIGIHPEFHDKIFTMFQRLHNRTVYPGTGIGLAICKKIAESHGGTIWVTSEDGKGSTFYFTIKK